MFILFVVGAIWEQLEEPILVISLKSHWEHGGRARMVTIWNTSGTIISK